jgi:hypothetical protein
MKIDAPELSRDLGAAPREDPTAALESPRGVSDEVSEVGIEEIRGVETTHTLSSSTSGSTTTDSSGARR